MDNNSFDKKIIKHNKCISKEETDVNMKYEIGNSRVVTETGAYKVALIKDIFGQDNYNLHPEFQRRITWDKKKRSKLIESLIINIPIPPIFLYEYDYDKYEVMDGLQRLSSIIAFYKNEYALSGLEEWSELNGKKYDNLPTKIREGIDRRQIQVITLLKETAATSEKAERIKRLVFERLNTGGVKLLPQEIRNAIHNGAGNQLCIKLSDNSEFRNMWDIPSLCDVEFDILDEQQIEVEDEKLKTKLERHSLYKRMYDVELVLRFFAMRHVDEFEYALADFLDDTLIALNDSNEADLHYCENTFLDSIHKAYALFGSYAFKSYKNNNWSSPTRMVYDPLMIAISSIKFEIKTVDNAIEMLKQFYDKNITPESDAFDGKHQSKDDICTREKLFEDLIRGIINE